MCKQKLNHLAVPSNLFYDRNYIVEKGIPWARYVMKPLGLIISNRGLS